MIRYNDLFYTCSLIEYIGRETHNLRADVIDKMGKSIVNRIYNYADVFHCEPIEKVANDFIERCQIDDGDFDNVGKCRYDVPSYWDIGAVFARLIEDIFSESLLIDGLFEVYHSWIEPHISNYNTDFFYQTREYIAVCYEEGQVLE